MAPAPFPSLLALDLNPGPRAASDLESGQGVDRAHGHREPLARARKIQAVLMKLGIRVSLATIPRYVPKPKPDPSQQQRSTTFLRNHSGVIAGMDSFVAPTARFRLLYVWFAIDHGHDESCTSTRRRARPPAGPSNSFARLSPTSRRIAT
jgi:hypothetical protein